MTRPRTRQLELPLITPSDHVALLHPPRLTTPARVALAHAANSRWTEQAVDRDALALAVANLAGEADWYVGQNLFAGRRRVEQLTHLSTLWADLDYYKIEGLQGLIPEAVCDIALSALDQASIPLPNFAVATGRGLLLIWLMVPVPGAALPRWRAMQREITKRLSHVGADPLTCDPTRVFRLIGTTNSRAANDDLVRPILQTTLARQKFEDLAKAILPLERAEAAAAISLTVRRAQAAAEGKGPKPATALSRRTWGRALLTDLHSLALLRYGPPPPKGSRKTQLPPGHRDAWIFLAAVALAWEVPSDQLGDEVVALARHVAGWSEREARARTSAVLRRSIRAARGEMVSFNGTERDPRYIYKSDTLVELLGVTGEEMEAAGLRLIVDQEHRRANATARERANKRSRGEVKQDREDYISEQKQRAEATKARCEEAGVSLRTLQRRAKAQRDGQAPTRRGRPRKAS